MEYVKTKNSSNIELRFDFTCSVRIFNETQDFSDTFNIFIQVKIFARDRNLDEIDAGDYDQLTYEQIREYYPVEYEKRQEDKLGYRYPNGESYIDLTDRVRKGLDKLDFDQKVQGLKSFHFYYKQDLELFEKQVKVQMGLAFENL